MAKINPFKPNSPVPTAMFAGRYNELVTLEKGLFQTKNGQPENYIVTGDRGIGKSSMLLYLQHVSVGSIESVYYGSFNFLTINITVSDKLDILTLIRLTEKNIERETGKIEAVRKFLADTWSFVQRLKVMDSGISPAEQNSEVEIQLDNFTHSLSETCNRLTNPENGEQKKDGILFMFDECDNATPPLRFGYFLKTVTESLLRKNCQNVMFVIAGLPETAERLSQSHESSIRIFSQIKLRELSQDDMKFVIDKGIEAGNEINSEKTTIEGAAKEKIALYSEGYPHFIQQFAYSAFDFAKGNEITNDDVVTAAFRQGGALDAIGDRYYASAFYDKIKSDEYREVLSIMAEKLNNWVSKSEIRSNFSGDESALTNALSTLAQRKIILKNQSKLGEYRLQQRGFALWIKLFGSRKPSFVKK